MPAGLSKVFFGKVLENCLVALCLNWLVAVGLPEKHLVHTSMYFDLLAVHVHLIVQLANAGA